MAATDGNVDIIMYGATWCPDCKRAKQFFAEHRVPYRWIDIDGNPDAIAEIERINGGQRIVPTIIFPDGTTLAEPSNADLAAHLGLQTRAMMEFYDVIIIGGGPTGLMAAIYTSRESLSTLVIEKAALGGQAGTTQVLENFPGFDEGISGKEFADRLSKQAQRFGTETLQATEVTDIWREGQYLRVQTGSGDVYGAYTVLIASGSHYRRLGIPGEAKLIGVNVHFCATCDGAFYRDKDLLVVGGGNSAFEEGIFLTNFARSVKVVESKPEVRASQILQDEVARREDITVVTNHAVKAFNVTEDNKLGGVVVEDRETGMQKTWHPDGVFVFIGLSPNADFLPEAISRDKMGFVQTDRTLMTTMEGVFAAGDVRSGSTKQAAAATGEGATAARMMRQYVESLGESHPHEVAEA